MIHNGSVISVTSNHKLSSVNDSQEKDRTNSSLIASQISGRTPSQKLNDFKIRHIIYVSIPLLTRIARR
jgi:hypothetical protein